MVPLISDRSYSSTVAERCKFGAKAAPNFGQATTPNKEWHPSSDIIIPRDPTNVIRITECPNHFPQLSSVINLKLLDPLCAYMIDFGIGFYCYVRLLDCLCRLTALLSMRGQNVFVSRLRATSTKQYVNTNRVSPNRATRPCSGGEEWRNGALEK